MTANLSNLEPVSLNYETLGSDQAQTTIMLIHGLFGDLDNLKTLARQLAEDYHCILVDVRNHGDSPHSDVMTYPAMATDIKALMQKLGLPQAIFIGHSMGGKIAMQVALHEPDLVKALVIADIAPVAYDERHRYILDALNEIDPSQLSKRQQADQQLAEHIGERGVRQFLLKNLELRGEHYEWRLNLPILVKNYEAITTGVSGTPYQGPALFIKGAESDYITSAHRATIQQLFPHAEAKIMNGVGHWLHAEKPQVFNKLVSDFLTAQVANGD